MLKVLKYAFLLFPLLVLACMNQSGLSTSSAQNVWKNNLLSHAPVGSEEPIRSYPWDRNLTDAERIDSAGFAAFILRKNVKFERSGLTVQKADSIHMALQNSEDFSRYFKSKDGRGARLEQNIRERVSLKRGAGKNEVEVFFKHYSCGWTFEHWKVVLDESRLQIESSQKVEVWSARRPC